jgi:L-galactose dehydrogenase
MSQRQPGISIVGLGCSSFSNFFDTQSDGDERLSQENFAALSLSDLSPSHPRVHGWIETVRYAVLEAGITVLDTAPWYGHGTSEIVVGFALKSLFGECDARGDGNDAAPTLSTSPKRIRRSDLTVNTKVGRYEADPKHQFDFSRETTLRSIQRSLERLQISYVDVLQLHDPEFAPSLEVLFEETIPGMLEGQERGWCRRLGMTGYPLHVQRQILDRSLRVFQRNIWDQSLVYSHYNLHDTSLYYPPASPRRGHRSSDGESAKGGDDVEDSSFAAYCSSHKIRVMTAAPLSMGLLTKAGPPPWHPASDELKEACRAAAHICEGHGVDVSELAMLFALSHPSNFCTILGMKSVPQVQAAARAAARITSVLLSQENENAPCCDDTLWRVLTDTEREVYAALKNPVNGPFARVWKDGSYRWDGVRCARYFWKHEVGIDQEPWHANTDEV